MMKVAAIQMVSCTRPDDNLRAARALLEQAASAGAELAVLPEYFCVMGHKDTDKLALREAPGEGRIQHFLASAARELQMWIVGGTLPLVATTPDRVRNTTLVFNPAGDCVARYDKIHLFYFDNGREQFHEGRVIEAGNTPVQFELPPPRVDPNEALATAFRLRLDLQTEADRVADFNRRVAIARNNPLADLDRSGVDLDRFDLHG